MAGTGCALAGLSRPARPVHVQRTPLGCPPSTVGAPGDGPAGYMGTMRGSTIPVSVAPMMDHTDRHLRTFLRCISPSALLYTEMVHSNALLHGEPARFLAHDPVERPVSLQLGGDDPCALARAAQRVEEAGFDEVNLNVGCPSPRVQRGNFGACLMATPEVVAEVVEAMRAAVSIPVTVKHRIGVDHLDTYEHMLRFVDVVSASGADRFTVHARKAWLKGLSPAENRSIPPLRCDEVYQLKRERPHLAVELNGGVRTVTAVREHLEHLDAVMIGRASYEDPWLLHDIERDVLSGVPSSSSRHEAVRAFIPYVARRVEQGETLHHMTRHLLGLFAGRPGARAWRRFLGTHPGAQDGLEAEAILTRALSLVPGA